MFLIPANLGTRYQMGIFRESLSGNLILPVRQTDQPMSEKATSALDHISLLTLYCFICAFKLRGYTPASYYLGISQPSVSRRVKGLEEFLGCRLLTSQRPPSLTGEGEEFYTTCVNYILSILDFGNALTRGVLGYNLSPSERRRIQMQKLLNAKISSYSEAEEFINDPRNSLDFDLSDDRLVFTTDLLLKSP